MVVCGRFAQNSLPYTALGRIGCFVIDKRNSATWYKAVDPDVRLMLQARDNDDEAFDQLVRKYHRRVYAMLLKYVRVRSIAEELTQDTFLRVYEARKRYVPQARFSTWLFKIVRNLALNEKRRKSRRPETSLPDCPPSELCRSDAPSPLDHLEAAERSAALRRCMTELTHWQHQAINLRCYSQMSYAEVAAELETSPKAVKSLLFRARAKLREELEEHYELA